MEYENETKAISIDKVIMKSFFDLISIRIALVDANTRVIGIKFFSIINEGISG